MDDENIVRRMIDGDMDAFGELMRRYEKPALRAAWLICGNVADSEDIVQEAFTACYLNRKSVRKMERNGQRRNLLRGRRIREDLSWKTAL